MVAVDSFLIVFCFFTGNQHDVDVLAEFDGLLVPVDGGGHGVALEEQQRPAASRSTAAGAGPVPDQARPAPHRLLRR